VRVGAFAADYLQAQRGRTLLQHEFAQVMNAVDVRITPTSLQPAERFDEFEPASPLRRSFTRIFNCTGMPAISICCELTASGLPLGLQIAGRAFDEAMVLRVAHTYERHTAWRQKRPFL
jgi:aspartyl-tRNA(Asn)/glutamyl-tRNA(Gln) amidotransferase subunit A